MIDALLSRTFVESCAAIASKHVIENPDSVQNGLNSARFLREYNDMLSVQC